ncbi:MAG TPA: response regulator transcription factor [Chitinophagaceae bacterium]|nr:response regulator transcription factor [Chitinophagaceae bacterium]
MRNIFYANNLYFPSMSGSHRNTDFLVALADDHALIRNGLAGLINSFDGFKVIFQAGNGNEFIDALKTNPLPDVVLMDINMPKKDGYETTLWLKNNHPSVLVLALSMYDNESAIIRMLKCGARGYILKDAEPSDLKRALTDITTKGFYLNEMVTGHLIHTMQKMDSDAETKTTLHLTDKEIDFLKLICTELTYKEIADRMNLSPRTVDGYRDNLFDRLNVKTRVGLVLYAIKNNIVNLGKGS